MAHSQPASLLRGANAPGLRNVLVGLRSPHFAGQTLRYWFLVAVERCFAVIGQRLTPLFGARHDRVDKEVLDINQQASGSSKAMLEKSPVLGDHSTDACQPTICWHLVSGCSLPRIRSEWAFGSRSATRLEQYVGATKYTRQHVGHVWTELMCASLLEPSRSQLSRPRDSRYLPTHEQQASPV